MYNDNYLQHHGVKGMKWGVRRKAKADAKEYARAKMFYGEGAGTRRKLINNKVQQRSKDPVYKEHFDKALANQNMEKHVAKAKRERKVRDAVNVVAGRPERAGATAVALVGAYGLAKSIGYDKVIHEAVKRKAYNVYNSAQTEYGRYKVKQLLRRSMTR